MSEASFTLDAGRVLRAAEYSAGAHGLADDGLRDRLRQLVAQSHASGQVNVANAALGHAQLHALLHRRLRIAADLRRWPAIADEVIPQPVFVVGYARTGTSLMHALLACDPTTQAPRWWQAYEPSPPPGLVPPTPFRLSTARRRLDAVVDATPGLLTMHPYWDEGEYSLIEDDEVFTLDLHGAYPDMIYNLPGLDVYSGAAVDAGAAFAFHKQFLQHQQHGGPARRWVLKGTQHQFFLDALFAVYPDARCVWTHRDPVETYASVLGICSVVYSAHTAGGIDWPVFAKSFIAAMRAGADHVLQVPVTDDPRITHVPFREFTADPVALLGRLYEQWGWPMTDAHRAAMQDWLARNPGDRYGRYDYSLEPFSLDAAALREQFADYNRRFGV